MQVLQKANKTPIDWEVKLRKWLKIDHIFLMDNTCTINQMALDLFLQDCGQSDHYIQGIIASKKYKINPN